MDYYINISSKNVAEVESVYEGGTVSMKKKMSNRRFMSIWIPIVSVMVVLAIGANIAGSVFGGILDTSLGRGERHVLHL